MRTVFGIAERRYEMFGHGSGGEVVSIRKACPYGTGAFRPLFEKREDAEAYLATEMKSYGEHEIVEIELR